MLSQRSEDRQVRWKAPGDLFDPSMYEVAAIDVDNEAKRFVETHHYSGSYPSAAHRFGLYTSPGELVGCAVFSVGTNNRTITNVFGQQLELWQEVFELGRFVLRDQVAYNAESWFLARCFEHLNWIGVRGVVSFSDPCPRQRQDGSVAFLGHWGQIYQASNAVYTGRASKRTLKVFRTDGLVFSDRTQQKIRKQEKGWRYSVAQLVQRGAAELQDGEDTAEWLNRELPKLTRSLRHPGNHRYVFTLGKGARPRVLVPELERPKRVDQPL